MTKTNRILANGVLMFFIAFISIFIFNSLKTKIPSDTSTLPKTVNNFEDCAAANYPIMESYPRQCRAKGVNYAEDIGNELEKVGLIKITYPRPNDLVTSPLEIKGSAKGTWYFEASFPVFLYDSGGSVIAQGVAEAEGDWMTDDFVSFTATLQFTKPKTAKGQLVLRKDNPSGLPENDDELTLPLKFN